MSTVLNKSGGGITLADVTASNAKQSGRMIPNNDYVGAATAMELSGLLNTATFTDSTAVNEMDGDGVYFKQTSSVSSGADQGWFEQVDKTRMDHVPFFAHTFLFATAVTNLRFFVGLADITSLSDISDADTLTVPAVGIQYSTNRSDTTFQALENDGATQAITDTTVTVAQSTFYHFELDVESTSTVKIRITDAAGDTQGNEITLNTNLPGSTVGLRPVLLINPLAAQAHQVQNYQCYLESRAYI